MDSCLNSIIIREVVAGLVLLMVVGAFCFCLIRLAIKDIQ